MKLYGIYRGDKRIKRYGLHKTYEKALYAYDKLWRGIESHDLSIFDRLLTESVMGGFGHEIKVAKETE